MYKWAVVLFLISIGGFALARYLPEDAPFLLWIIVGSLVCLVLSFIFTLLDKIRADIKYLKKSWRIDQQYKHEKEAEKSALVSTGEAKKRYLEARKRHILLQSSEDADVYITYNLNKTSD